MRKAVISFSACVLLCIPMLAQASQTAEQDKSNKIRVTSRQPTEAAHPGSSRNDVPPSLKNVGEYGEDIYDAVKADNWGMAGRKLGDLQQTSRQLSSEQQQQLHAELRTLAASVHDKNRVSAMHEANQITRTVADMSAQYHPAVPVRVAMLDYYGRQLEIALTQHDRDELHNVSKEIAKSWQQLRPEVEKRGASLTAAKWDGMVKRLQSATTITEFKQRTQQELDEVDKLEKVFERSPSANR